MHHCLAAVGLVVPIGRVFSCRLFEFNAAPLSNVPLSREASCGGARTPELIDSPNPPSIGPSQACCVAGGLFLDDNFSQMSGSRRPPRLRTRRAPKGDLEIRTRRDAQRAPHARHHPSIPVEWIPRPSAPERGGGGRLRRRGPPSAARRKEAAQRLEWSRCAALAAERRDVVGLRLHGYPPQQKRKSLVTDRRTPNYRGSELGTRGSQNLPRCSLWCTGMQYW